METEYHVIDKNGRISYRASEIIATLKRCNPEIEVTKEIGQNMIEFGCYPDAKTFNPMLHLVRSVECANQIAQKKGLLIYPFGTYPNKFDAIVTEGKQHYDLKKNIFAERFDSLTEVVGFHHHYSLPKSVFDHQKKELRVLRKSKLARSMVSCYNLEIAADPALTLFTQSSPFYHGEYLAKDSRMVIYRGGKKLGRMSGAYAKMATLGGLPPYKQTATDIVYGLQRRQMKWRGIVRKADPSVDFDELYPFKLDIGWNPVKVNKHGTLEQRGMDTNYLSIVAGVTVLLKSVLRKIQRDFIEVIPADFAMDEPFKMENGIMYIPPHTYVRNKLQAWSAYLGYERKEAYDYAKKFFSMAKSLSPKRYADIIRPINDMIDNKISMSDNIVNYAKKNGFMDDGRITQEAGEKIALHFAEAFQKDLEFTKKKLLMISQL